MYINITGSSNNKDVYIYQSFRKENGKTSSHIYKKLGKMNDLLAQFDNDKERMMEWARNEAKKETELYNQKNGKVSVDFSQGARIMKNEQRLFNVGYLFLSVSCTELRLDKICRSIKGRHKYQYDLLAVFTDLIYARILHPSSKREVMNTVRLYWNHRSIICRMFTVPFPLLPRNPILYRVNCTRIPTLSIPGTKKSCTTTAQISILRLNRKTNCANTVKAKNTDQIQS